MLNIFFAYSIYYGFKHKTQRYFLKNKICWVLWFVLFVTFCWSNSFVLVHVIIFFFFLCADIFLLRSKTYKNQINYLFINKLCFILNTIHIPFTKEKIFWFSTKIYMIMLKAYTHTKYEYCFRWFYREILMNITWFELFLSFVYLFIFIHLCYHYFFFRKIKIFFTINKIFNNLLFLPRIELRKVKLRLMFVDIY